MSEHLTGMYSPRRCRAESARVRWRNVLAHSKRLSAERNAVAPGTLATMERLIQHAEAGKAHAWYWCMPRWKPGLVGVLEHSNSK